jgi:hypothetical protein
MDLMGHLLAPNPKERGLYTSMDRLAHQHMLVHPFWWDARKMLSFLVTIGNYAKPPVEKLLEDAIQECIDRDVGPGGSWVRHLDPAVTKPAVKPPYWRAPEDSPWGLLRFIRHNQIHLQDKFFDKAAKKVLSKPYFLDSFPSLVVKCWLVLLKCRDSHSDIIQSLLRPFLFHPVAPTLRLPQDSAIWA